MSATMLFTAKTPALRMLIPLIIGIIAGEYLRLPIGLLWICLGVLLLAISAFRFIPVYFRFRLQLLRGVLVSLVIFSIGHILLHHARASAKEDWYGHSYEIGQQLLLKTEGPFARRAKSNKTKVAVIGRWDGSELKPASGALWLYGDPQAIKEDCPVGSLLITKQAARAIQNTGNPGAFDYAVYSARQGVTGQVYIRDSTQVSIIRDTGFSVKKMIIGWRHGILNQLRNCISGKEEAGLAEALLVGYKEDLDEELLRSYSNTGVVHVIAVSGMHLALIYWLIQKLLLPLSALPKTKWLSFFIAVSLLWIFSLIAGGAASIVRAAVMFTCLLLGQTISRQSNVYNTLAVSALLLLCYDPYWLWDAGFQLSYLAVLSIVIFYKPIYNLVYCRYKPVDWLWQLCAVTCAAQILTTPVSIYLFHQFPLCFLLTNIPVVPLSSLILVAEIILLALGFNNNLSKLAGVAVEWMIRLMNDIVDVISKIPFAVWEGLSISMAQVLLLYLFILLICWSVSARSVKLLLAGFAVLNIVGLLRYMDFVKVTARKKLLVFNMSDGGRLSFVNGRMQWIQDASLLSPVSVRNTIKPTLCLYRTTLHDKPEGLEGSGNLVMYDQYRVFIADSLLKPGRIKDTVEADLLFVRGTARDSAIRWLQKIRTGQVVLDRRMSMRKRADWKEAAVAKKIPFHDMNERGAFIQDIRH